MADLEALAQRHLLALSRDHGQDVWAFGVVPSKLQAADAIKALAQVRLHRLWTLALHPANNTLGLCKPVILQQLLHCSTM